MPHEGFVDPISEFTEHVTRATKASNGNSTPPVAEIMDGATITKMSRPLTESPPWRGLEEGWTCEETKRTVVE